VRRPGFEWAVAVAALTLVTVALLPARDALDKTHVALAYLLVVLGVSSRGGRAVGIMSSIAAFLSFNFFFLPPHYTFVVADPLNWAVLGAFLVTSLVAAQLLTRAQSEAAAAEERAGQIERLSTLGAETLNAPRAEQALGAIVEVIRNTLRAATCEIHVLDEATNATRTAARAGQSSAPAGARDFGQPSAERVLEWVATNGRAAAELQDGSMRLAESADSRGIASMYAENIRTLVLPLRVRDRTVGVLTITPEQMLSLNTAQERFLDALSYYAALGVERLRLSRDADRAAELQRADEVKNAVLASVSHDLRTPLTTIKALANEIRKDGDDRAATIEEEADRLNRFVADLLDLSRLAGGALRVNPEINAAEDLVGAAMQRISGAAAGRHVVASLDASEPLLLGRFDFVHSLRVLGNLIENAIKFAPSESSVEVTARRDNGILEFIVLDRGPGIPQADRDVVFQPFYRREQSAAAGLGLSIARGLAEAQGGGVRYEPRDGGGSVFVFSVPAADARELESL
jgi:two-component system, OmpR family, sensor histidine kinase KdpD